MGKKQKQKQTKKNKKQKQTNKNQNKKNPKQKTKQKQNKQTKIWLFLWVNFKQHCKLYVYCSLNSQDLFLNLRRLVKMTKPLRFENKSLRLKFSVSFEFELFFEPF